ncbi:Uncharacterised protein [Serratia plymuthica]|nr:hypothetical protein SOD10_11870 [Serratia plymuthica]CAI1002545.1 Uncharacterised protein [Serratia plymuthica]
MEKTAVAHLVVQFRIPVLVTMEQMQTVKSITQ